MGSDPIVQVKSSIDDGSFSFGGFGQFAGWDSTMGFAFENLVVNNLRSLVAPLHLDGVMILSAAPYFRRGGEGGGCQVDLLIQSKMSMYVVEIKRKTSIGREVMDEVREKCRRLPRRRSMSLHTALVYDGNLAPSIEADGYFDAIIPFSRLLGL